MTDPRALLERSTTIAVVGMSRDPAKAANRIPALLVEAGFRVFPVNPSADRILGLTCYPSLADVPEPVDIVDVFRPSGDAATVARQAVAAGAGAVWLQTGIRSAEARAVAEAAGLGYVEDRCIGVEVQAAGIRADRRPTPP